MLVEYERWFASGSSAVQQLDSMIEFLRCAGVRLSSTIDRARLRSLVRPEEKHRTADKLATAAITAIAL